MSRKTTGEQCECPECQGTGRVGREKAERIKAAREERGAYEPRGLPALIEADNRDPYMGNDD